MKIARFTHGGQESWGDVDTDAGTVRPVRGTIVDWGDALTRGENALEPAGEPVPLADVRLLAPIAATSTVVGVGLNYWGHTAPDAVRERPASTLGYLKPHAAIVGPDDEIRYRATTEQLDFEVELVAVVGRADIESCPTPTDAVLGYTIGNDVSARDAVSPLGGPDLFSMKALGNATPLGPWITTKDELGGAGQVDLEFSLKVDGDVRQHDRTKNMIWSVDELFAYVLERMPLRVGDVLFTGTTSGVAMEDGRYLQPGEVVECEIEGIGILKNVVGARR
jgi:2-keto-4-pentenoate hydratase/2-oxohepta-3-ene-1,7-dioic acid hydratase in catechol pathway